MIYLISINFEKSDYIPKNDVYYWILGWFLDIFKDDLNIYDSILKISFSIDSLFTIHVSINSEENYMNMVNKLLEKKDINISINNHKLKFENLSIDTKIFDTTKKRNLWINKFELRFLSPTFIRNQNNVYTLPVPEKFLFSSWLRCSNFLDRDIDNKDLKLWIKKKHNDLKIFIKYRKNKNKMKYKKLSIGILFLLYFSISFIFRQNTRQKIFKTTSTSFIIFTFFRYG